MEIIFSQNTIGKQLIKTVKSEQNKVSFQLHSIWNKQIEECYKQNAIVNYHISIEKQKYENALYHTIDDTNLFNARITELMAYKLKIDNDIANLVKRKKKIEK